MNLAVLAAIKEIASEEHLENCTDFKIEAYGNYILIQKTSAINGVTGSKHFKVNADSPFLRYTSYTFELLPEEEQKELLTLLYNKLPDYYAIQRFCGASQKTIAEKLHEIYQFEYGPDGDEGEVDK